MTLIRWKNYEVPDHEGVVHASGKKFRFQGGHLSPSDSPNTDRFLSVGVLASHTLYGDKYRVRCGEACEHGSIGVIVLENAKSGEAIWAFASDQTNPFDQIEVKGGYVLVLSTSGAVFRFREEFDDVTLSIP